MNRLKKSHLCLYSSSVAVAGVNHSAIYSFQQGKIYQIPNTLYEVLHQLKYQSIKDIQQVLLSEEIQTFRSYLDFVLDNNLGFLTDEPERFPDIDLTYKTPSLISRAVISYNDSSRYNLSDTILKLECLNLWDLELRIDSDRIDFIYEVLRRLDGTRIRSIKMLAKGLQDCNDEYYISLYDSFPKLSYLIITDRSFEQTYANEGRSLLMTTDHYCNLCSKSFSLGFSKELYSSIEFFTEAKCYNVYLNKKVAIDPDGNIKNCIDHQKVFGVLQNDDLTDVIRSTEFQELWHVSVDMIEGVSTSEFRYGILVTDELEKVQNSNIYRMLHADFSNDMIISSNVRQIR